MEIAVTSVERTESRKTRITATAKPRPSSPSTVRSWMDCSMKGAWSKTVVNVASGPSCAASPGSSAATAWEMPTVSPSGFLVTDTASVSTPLVRVIEVAASSCMLTSASSESSCTPLAPRTGRDFTASRESMVEPEVTGRSRPSVSRRPTGIRPEPSSMTSFRSLAFKRSVASLAVSGSTAMCWDVPPETSAVRTPSTLESLGSTRRSTSARRSFRFSPPETAR